jgi:ATP/maltotriose-dependent transcriptional regulator MalT
VLIDLGRLDEAQSILDRVAADRLGAHPRQGSIETITRARLARSRGDGATAVSLADQAVDLVAGHNAILDEARTREQCAEILSQNGQAAAGRREFERSIELYAAKEFRPGEDRARRALARLASARAEA